MHPKGNADFRDIQAVDLKRILSELRAEYARLSRAIEDLERLYGVPTGTKPPRIEVKRLGRPRKKNRQPQ